MKKLGIYKFLCLIFTISFFSVNYQAYSQFGIIKDIENKVDDVKNQKCDDLEKLKDRLKMIKELLDKNDLQMMDLHNEKAQEFLSNIKSKCPWVSTGSYETELEGYQKRYEDLKTKNASAAAEKQNDLSFFQSAMSIANEMSNYFGSSWQGMYNEKESAQKFYDNANKLSYPATRKKMDDLVKKKPEYNNESNEINYYYREFKEFKTKFDEWTSSFLVTQINKCIEDAYALKAKGKSSMTQAMDMADASLLACDGWLLVEPDNEQAKNLRIDAKAAVDKIGSGMESIYSSAFHKENIGKFLFSNSIITIKAENPSKIKNEFKAGEYIYGMAYMKGTFKELTHGGYKVRVRIYVDGNEKMSRDFEVAREKWEFTYLNFEIVPDPATSETMGCIEYSKALSELSPRMHQVRITFEVADYGTILAEGEFSLDCSDGMDKLAKIANDLHMKQFMKIKLPDAGMKDAKLEKEMLQSLSSWTEKPLRAVITSTEWKYETNAFGVILHRYIWGAVAFKLPEGTCRIFYLSFKQDYNGKSYGKTEHWGVGDSEDMPCENVNK